MNFSNTLEKKETLKLAYSYNLLYKLFSYTGQLQDLILRYQLCLSPLPCAGDARKPANVTRGKLQHVLVILSKGSVDWDLRSGTA